MQLLRIKYLTLKISLILLILSDLIIIKKNIYIFRNSAFKGPVYILLPSKGNIIHLIKNISQCVAQRGLFAENVTFSPTLMSQKLF